MFCTLNTLLVYAFLTGPAAAVPLIAPSKGSGIVGDIAWVIARGGANAGLTAGIQGSESLLQRALKAELAANLQACGICDDIAGGAAGAIANAAVTEGINGIESLFTPMSRPAELRRRSRTPRSTLRRTPPSTLLLEAWQRGQLATSPWMVLTDPL